MLDENFYKLVGGETRDGNTSDWLADGPYSPPIFDNRISEVLN